MAIDLQKVTQLALGQGGRLFPSVAGRLAFDLFCRTANPLKPGKGERAAIEKAAPLMAKARHHMMREGSICFSLHQFKANPGAFPRGKMLILHGWRSRSDFMARMASYLAAQGFEVFVVDLPGHGRSSGRKLNVRLGVEVVQAANRWFGPFDLIAGHSFGGVVAVNAAVGGIADLPPVPTGKIAIIASPNSMPELFRKVGYHFGLTKNAQAAMERRVHQVAGHPISNYVLADQLQRFDGEVLIMHARDDREVPFSNAQAMVSAGAHVRLLPFEGLGHRRIISNAKVFVELDRFASGRTRAVAI